MAAQFIIDWTEVDSHIADVLNAAQTWGGAIKDTKYTGGGIPNARKEACLEVLRAIAGNPKHGYWGELRTLVAHAYAVGENSVAVAAHDGEIGIPKIVPFAGATPRDGISADPDEIDAYRLETADNPRFTGSSTGVGIPHDQADDNGIMSPLACRFSLVAGDFKFTGLSAQIPMIIIDETMRDERIPFDLWPTVVKRAIPKLVKPGGPVAQIANAFGQDGKQDLVEINGGQMVARPVRAVADIIAEQKQL